MSKLTVVSGDLFTSRDDALGHGVNIRGDMSGGIAAVFARRFPEMHEAYKQACLNQTLLGGGVFPWYDEPSGQWIYNIASQVNPGRDANLFLLERGVQAALDHAFKEGVRSLTLPRIGCGIGGLQWENVHSTLEAISARNPRMNLTVYVQ